jgi:hypothetical protein
MSNPLEQISRTLPQILMQAAENAAKDAVTIVRSRVRKGVSSDGSLFSNPYSKSHKARREKKGLQTGVKDLHYSGTMFENLGEVSRSSTPTTATVSIAFEGQADRRSDQEGATNQQVAEWLSDQENKNIIALSEKEKELVGNSVARSIAEFIQNIQIND